MIKVPSNNRQRPMMTFTPEVQRHIDRMNAIATQVKELLEELESGRYSFKEAEKVLEMDKQLKQAIYRFN